MGAPPSLAGADQDSVTRALPGAAARFRGAPGTVAATAPVDLLPAADHGPSPSALRARTCTW